MSYEYDPENWKETETPKRKMDYEGQYIKLLVDSPNVRGLDSSRSLLTAGSILRITFRCNSQNGGDVFISLQAQPVSGRKRSRPQSAMALPDVRHPPLRGAARGVDCRRKDRVCGAEGGRKNARSGISGNRGSTYERKMHVLQGRKRTISFSQPIGAGDSQLLRFLRAVWRRAA